MEAIELEAKEVLKKLFPKVSVPSNLVRLIYYFVKHDIFITVQESCKQHLHSALVFNSAPIPYSFPFLT